MVKNKVVGKLWSNAWLRWALLILGLLLVLALGNFIYYNRLAQKEYETRQQYAGAITEEERTAILRILDESGVPDRISDGQEWAVSWDTQATSGLDVGGTRGVLVHVRWGDGTAVDGEWQYLSCNGTRKLVRSRSYRDITWLSVWIDLPGERVVAYTPLRWPESRLPLVREPGGSKFYRMYDMSTGRFMWYIPLPKWLPNFIKCAPGTYYRD